VELNVTGSDHTNQLGAKGAVLYHKGIVSIQAK
jgi:hypothetical protein